jgi:DNA-binding MarR family transcriptional regulator
MVYLAKTTSCSHEWSPRRVESAVSQYEKSINYNIYTLASSLFKGATQFYVAHFGVGQPEMRVLSTLGSHGGMPAYQLATLTAMDKALISRVLAALARRTYVRAEAPETDIRRRVWELTPSGRALVARLQPVWKQREAIIQADLSAEEQKLLVDMLQRMLRASEALRAEEAQQIKAEKRASRRKDERAQRTPARSRAPALQDS